MNLKHVALYAKGHYERNNLWEDLKACLAEDDYDTKNDWWTNRDTVSLITAHVPAIFKNKELGYYTQKLLDGINPNLTWRYGYVHSLCPPMIKTCNENLNENIPEFDLNEAIVRFFLSELCVAQTIDLGGLPEADEKVLPLKKYETA